MIENPFFHHGPIRNPDYFYNRAKEVKRTLEMLSQGQSVSVIGPRKIGKTSLLFHISRAEVMRQHGLDPNYHLLVYFTCEGMGDLTLQEFYTLILEEVANRAAQYGYHLSIPERPVSYQEFERAIREAFDQKLRLVLLLDEFEQLSNNPNLGVDLLSGLRALATEFDIAYLTVSRRPLATFTEDHSPFFNIFLPLQLGLFNESESRELVERSLKKTDTKFPPKILDYILELGGGHPFFLQMVCYWALELQNTKKAPLESKDLHILVHTVRGQIESHFEYYWKHLTSPEQYVLAALPFTRNDRRYQEQLKALACLCLIVQEDNRYRYFSPLFRDFVRCQKVENLLQAAPFVLVLPHQQALRHEAPLPLSAKQFALLSYLMQRQGQVVSNRELDHEVMWASPEEQEKYEYLGDERLKSAIKGLRKALGSEADCIVNRRGVGYMFQPPVEEETQ
jgi:DNA-binding winged helix-turn-helix (wHTH) protein